MSKKSKRLRFETSQLANSQPKEKKEVILNLVELRRQINKTKMRFPQKNKHLKDLHKIQKARSKMRENLKNLQNEKESKQFSFKPEFNKKSLIMMRRLTEPQVERSENWLKLKKEKLDTKKKVQEKFILKKENKEAKKKLFNNRIKGVSKVKKIIDVKKLDITKSFVPQKKQLFRNKGFDYNFSKNKNQGYKGEAQDKFAATDEIFKDKVSNRYVNINDLNKAMKKRLEDGDFWKP